MAGDTGVSATVKLIDMKVVTGEKITIAGARIGEKVDHLRANLSLGLHRLRHPVHPEHGEECVEVTAETMTAATDKRLRREQEAKDKAEWQRAMARERRAYKMSRRREHSHSAHKPTLQEA